MMDFETICTEMYNDNNISNRIKAWLYFHSKILSNEFYRRYPVFFPEINDYPFYADDADMGHFTLAHKVLLSDDDTNEFWGWVEFFFDFCLKRNTTFEIVKSGAGTGYDVFSKIRGPLVDLNLYGFVEKEKFDQSKYQAIHMAKLPLKQVNGHLVCGPLSLVPQSDSGTVLQGPCESNLLTIRQCDELTGLRMPLFHHTGCFIRTTTNPYQVFHPYSPDDVQRGDRIAVNWLRAPNAR